MHVPAHSIISFSLQLKKFSVVQVLNFYILSSVHGHLDYFRVLAIVGTVEMNIDEHVTL